MKHQINNQLGPSVWQTKLALYFKHTGVFWFYRKQCFMRVHMQHLTAPGLQIMR